MAKRNKPTQRQLAELRAEYLQRREELLVKKVNGLQVKLFDSVFNDYLSKLEQSNGRILNTQQNKNLITNLDRIYDAFNATHNAVTVKTFINDLIQIHDLNKKYFSNINPEGTRASAPVIEEAINKGLGIDQNGNLIQGGFADKFLKDKKSLKSIKRIANKAVRTKQGFVEFKDALKQHIKGQPGTNGGTLQQYYRNYAYDTYQKVDRINGDKFATALDLRYFIYSGGLINTSRGFCIKRNGRIIDSTKFKKLTYSSLPENQRGGIPSSGWNPMEDLGGYGCRHSKDWVTDSFAMRNFKLFSDRANNNISKLKKRKKK